MPSTVVPIFNNYFVRKPKQGMMGAMKTETAGHGLGPTRARVLRHLLSSEGSVSVQTVAEALALHSNTARFHLEALVESGYASRGIDRSHGQGRPRSLYNVTPEAPVVDAVHLRDMTEVLVRQLILSAPDPDRVAEDVGRAWGHEMGESAAKTRTHANAKLDGLLQYMTAMGFTSEQGDGSVRYHHCPYRRIGQPALGSICKIHLGMMRGYLEAADSGLDVESLTIGDVCIARLMETQVLGNTDDQEASHP